MDHELKFHEHAHLNSIIVEDKRILVIWNLLTHLNMSNTGVSIV